VVKSLRSSTRTCVITDVEGDPKRMIRLVADPEGHLVADVAGKLPGRGVWITPDRDGLKAAIEDGRLLKRASRTLKGQVTLAGDGQAFIESIDRLLTRQCLSLLGFERKAGRVVFGFEKVKDKLIKGYVAVLIEASDAKADGVSKILSAALKSSVPVMIIDLFDRQELSTAMGRDNVVHATLSKGGATTRLLDDVLRLAAFRGTPIVKRGGEPIKQDLRGKQEPDDGRS